MVSRRNFVKGIAASAGLAVTAGVWAPKAEAQPASVFTFGSMFPQLPAYSVPDAALSALAETMRDRAPGSPLGDNLFYDGTTLTSAFPAGLTYVGQFLDHDMTLDLTPLSAASDADSVRNFRNPALNLDSVYAADPLFGLVPPVENGRFLTPLNVFGVLDYPRTPQGFAIIGDFRNDENLVLQPVHLGIMRFHNALLDKGVATSFEQAQQLTRHYYQWTIATEFLPAVIGQPLTDELINVNAPAKAKVFTRFYRPPLVPTGVPVPPQGLPKMPIEFSAACYRLHTLIRNNYTIRLGTRVGIFNTQPLNLVGGRPVPPELVQQSDLFFRTATSPAFDPPNTQANALSFNVARKLDASISPQLYNLPAFALPSNPEFNNLPVRNLIRGTRIGLAAGQDVARAMGVTPLTNAELNENAANVAGGTHGVTDPVFQNKVPLWFYFNKEAELLTGGRRLGPVGGRIVGEVIAGLLGSDPTSFANTDFVPDAPVAPTRGQFKFADVLRFAGAI
jgi:hypothetical protein